VDACLGALSALALRKWCAGFVARSCRRGKCRAPGPSFAADGELFAAVGFDAGSAAVGSARSSRGSSRRVGDLLRYECTGSPLGNGRSPLAGVAASVGEVSSLRASRVTSCCLGPGSVPERRSDDGVRGG